MVAAEEQQVVDSGTARVLPIACAEAYVPSCRQEPLRPPLS